MMRVFPLLLIACCLALHGASAQTANRKDCVATDPSCSGTTRGLSAIGSLAFAPKADGALVKGDVPGLVVAPVTLVEPGSRARLQIQLSAQQALPKNCFVRIRGLPSSATVSPGHAIAAGAWAIPIVALPDLTIGAADGVAGWSEVAIALVMADGPVLAETKTKLVVASRSGDVATAGARLSLTPEDHDRALQFHAQGVEQLKLGNIAAARKFFALGTEAELPHSMMELASTYDPNELSKLGAFGPLPDVETAQRWYRKAQQLGATGAEERLRRLGAR
jgi:TPR repeat protein